MFKEIKKTFVLTFLKIVQKHIIENMSADFWESHCENIFTNTCENVYNNNDLLENCTIMFAKFANIYHDFFLFSHVFANIPTHVRNESHIICE